MPWGLTPVVDASDTWRCGYIRGMARDDWRLRIDLGEAGTGGLLGRLGLWESDARELAHELKDRRLAVTEDGDTVFVYASTSLELEGAKAAIQAELDELDAHATSIVTEHWLAEEERWDDEAPSDPDAEVLAEGYAPWEVRIPARDHKAARELADRLHGEVEAGGEMVYESMPQNPFRFFGGLADV